MRPTLIFALLLATLPATAAEPAPPPTPAERQLAEHINRLDLEIAALRKENVKLKIAIMRLAEAVESTANPKPSGAMARSKFAEAVYGKTPDEVVRAVGKPAESHDDTDGYSTWYYENVTYDPANGKFDSRVPVRFHNGRVTDVSF